MSALTSSSADDMFGRFNKELFRNVTVILFFRKKESHVIVQQQRRDFPHTSSIILKEGWWLRGFCGVQHSGDTV